MKKILAYSFIFICFWLTGVTTAQDLSLPEETPAQVGTLAREMVSLGMPEDSVGTMTRNMMAHGFNETQMVKAQEMLIQTHRQGMPTEPLMMKAGEGIAKQVGPERILRAMEQVRNRYREAWKHAGNMPGNRQQRNEMGDAIAQGMAAGLGTEAVNRIADQLQLRVKSLNRSESSSLGVASFQAARDMVRMGLQSGPAGDLICMAISKGYTSERMNHLRNQFRTQNSLQSANELCEKYQHQFRIGRDPLSDDNGSVGNGNQQRQQHRNRQGNTDDGGGGSGNPDSGPGGTGGPGDSGGSDGSGGSGTSGGSNGNGGGNSGTGAEDGNGKGKQ